MNAEPSSRSNLTTLQWYGIPAGRSETSASQPRTWRAIRLPDLVRVRPRTRRCLRGVGPPTAQHGGVAVRRAGSRYPREPITGRLLFRISLSRNVRFGWRVQPVDATPSNLARGGGVRWRGLHGYGSPRSRGLSFGSAGRMVNVWRISLGRFRGGTRAVSIVSRLSMVALLRSRAGELRER